MIRRVCDMKYAIAFVVVSIPVLGQAPASSEGSDFFENKVRPVLAENCYDCHTAAESGGLRVDSRASLPKGVAPEDMLAELRTDNLELTRNLRSAHELCEKHKDVATASLIENWIDETERRTWFLSEIVTER